MPTIIGEYMGTSATGNYGRIELEYSRNYNDDHTQVQYNGQWYYATAYQTIDSSNYWSRWGWEGDASGKNVNINHGGYNLAGRSLVHSMSGQWRRSISQVGFKVWGVEKQGGGDIITKIGSDLFFTMTPGDLAPFINEFEARDITQTSATFRVANGDGNGGTLTDLAIWYNDTRSDTEGTYVEKGSWNAININTFVGGKTYYYKLRAKNNTYGWGPWTAWGSIITLPGVKVKVSSSWKNAQPYVRVNGVWKKADRWVNVNGVWKR